MPNQVYKLSRKGSRALAHLRKIGKENEYGTRIEDYNGACEEFEIRPTLDVAASKFNHVIDNYLTKKDNCFTKEITEDFFLNPPYDPEYKCLDCSNEEFTRATKKRKPRCTKCKSKNRKLMHKGVKQFIAWAYAQHLHSDVNALILTYAKTDTNWWHDYIEKKAEVHFIRGRFKFKDEYGVITKNPAPYPSCWIIYRSIDPKVPNYTQRRKTGIVIADQILKEIKVAQ